MSERRKENRCRAYIGGRAFFYRGQSSADVLIRNTSTSGAKLIVHNSQFVPDNFKLMVPKWQAEFRVYTCWRRHEEIGVEFEQVA